MAKRKPPAFQLYARDVLADPALARCSLAAQGAWWRLLCLFHENERSGQLEDDLEGLSHAIGRPVEEVAPLLEELARRGVADLLLDGSCATSLKGHKLSGIVTVRNRRMHREYLERVDAAERKRLQRDRDRKQAQLAEVVTEKSRSLSSSASASSSSEDRSLRHREAGEGVTSAGPDDEVAWRVLEVWEAHLEARRRFYERRNGKSPPVPRFDPDDIGQPIVDALHRHDAELLGPAHRSRWRAQSAVRAAGIGLFIDPFMCGQNDRQTDYLEPWRPWRRQRGKPDPVTRFSQLYFAARSKR